ncbi:MAG: hypothetical protein IPI78_18095 [Chitinophagaceae bacterium]|nr:hypothetical protein [Chitinophagaceae bacterium]
MQVDVYLVKSPFLRKILKYPEPLANEVVEIHPEVPGGLSSSMQRKARFVSQGAYKLYDGDLRAQLNKLNIQLALAQKTEESSG